MSYDVKVACPRCGSDDLGYDLACHTWPQTRDGREQWMSCLPCDSAVWYCCGDSDCGWTYTHGLNPRNPKAEQNADQRPAWVRDADVEGKWVMPHPAFRGES